MSNCVPYCCVRYFHCSLLQRSSFHRWRRWRRCVFDQFHRMMHHIVFCVCVCLRVVCICGCLRLQDTYFSLTLLFLAIFDRRSRLLIFFFVSVHLFTLLLGHFSLLLFRSPLFFRSSSLVVVFIVFIYLHNELFVAFIAYWDACWARWASE